MTLVTGVCNRAKSHHNSFRGHRSMYATGLSHITVASEVTGGWFVLILTFELRPMSTHSNNLTSLVQ